MGRKNDRSYTVWLPPRHKQMLDAMPDVKIGDISRKAIEELFEGRMDRDYAKLCISEDVQDLLNEWERSLGITGSFSLTGTEDGFRVVLTALKDYDG